MFNVLRMDIYRMFKSTSFWVCMAVVAGMIAFTVLSLWLVSNMSFEQGVEGVTISSTQANESGIFISSGDLDSSDMEDIAQAKDVVGNLDLLHYLGNMSVSGEFVGVLAAIFAALFIAGEFESGFSKNVFSSLKKRRSYFASKMLMLLLAVVIFFAIACIVAIVGALIAGFSVTAVPIGDFALWAALSILSFWALAMLTALFAWLTKTKTGALLIGIFVGVGMVGGIIASLVGLFPDISFVKDLTLYANWAVLSGGMEGLATSDTVRVACVGGAYLLLYSLLGMFILQKRDI